MCNDNQSSRNSPAGLHAVTKNDIWSGLAVLPKFQILVNDGRKHCRWESDPPVCAQPGSQSIAVTPLQKWAMSMSLTWIRIKFQKLQPAAIDNNSASNTTWTVTVSDKAASIRARLQPLSAMSDIHWQWGPCSSVTGWLSATPMQHSLRLSLRMTLTPTDCLQVRRFRQESLRCSTWSMQLLFTFQDLVWDAQMLLKQLCHHDNMFAQVNKCQCQCHCQRHWQIECQLTLKVSY